MSFSFGFTNDDFSDDDIEESANVNNVSVSMLNENPLDKLSGTIDESSYPKFHSLESILHTLNGVRLTFDNYTTPIGRISYIVVNYLMLSIKSCVRTIIIQPRTVLPMMF